MKTAAQTIQRAIREILATAYLLLEQIDSHGRGPNRSAGCIVTPPSALSPALALAISSIPR
jgi:hypothetical protein